MNQTSQWLLIVFSAANLFLGSSRANAQESTDKHWKAQWITAAGVAERDEVVLHFRKIVELKEGPKTFVVNVSADNQFVLYVNGHEVGRGPSRADLKHWRYET